ncbi:hypothetical protein [Carnobacterium viridans]|uniref:hypothetical protein n=1 Tax=Carnobacterium viridans TaxID=174587 RepID=UPI0015A0EDBF|nr:hypothetical protein [Carnobacterium viridans]
MIFWIFQIVVMQFGRLDDDEKATVGLTDGSQIRNYSIVNEFGLYNFSFIKSEGRS